MSQRTIASRGVLRAALLLMLLAAACKDSKPEPSTALSIHQRPRGGESDDPGGAYGNSGAGAGQAGSGAAAHNAGTTSKGGAAMPPPPPGPGECRPVSSSDNLPQRVTKGVPVPSGRRSTVTGAGAPVTASVAAVMNRAVNPPNSTSIAATPSGLPTSRLASRRLARSAAPPGGMPQAA